MSLRHYGFVNGVSEELERAREAATACAAAEADPNLKETLQQTAAHAEGQAERVCRRHVEDEDGYLTRDSVPGVRGC
jgi:hypothetical protein